MALEIEKARCPYCRELLHFGLIDKNHLDVPVRSYVGRDVHRFYGVQCAACNSMSILHMTGRLMISHPGAGDPTWLENPEFQGFVFPGPEITALRSVPKEVSSDYATDFVEASLVLAYSPKASAALSRRLLQRFLHEELKINKRDLASEIEELLNGGSLPSYIANRVDAIRHLGNFAAHPTRSLQTGTIVDVEPGEADWMLSILESLFDWHFVIPEAERQRTEALNAKLQEHGKKPIKGTSS